MTCDYVADRAVLYDERAVFGDEREGVVDWADPSVKSSWARPLPPVCEVRSASVLFCAASSRPTATASSAQERPLTMSDCR